MQEEEYVVRGLTDVNGFEHTLTARPNSSLYKRDAFAFKGATPQPWVSEYTHSFNLPQEWQSRVITGSVVHTGGGTQIGHWTHHTRSEPFQGRLNVPPGTTYAPESLRLTLRYRPENDPAVAETRAVCAALYPQIPELKASLEKYHSYANDEGWLTTMGFVSAARRAGIELSRAEFLALERAVPKDRMGKINYGQVLELISMLGAEDGSADAGNA